MSLWYMIVAHEIEARCIVLGEKKRREMKTERGNKKQFADVTLVYEEGIQEGVKIEIFCEEGLHQGVCGQGVRQQRVHRQRVR